MDRIDYSWDDQDPEQIQTWHETLGDQLNPIEEELVIVEADSTWLGKNSITEGKEPGETLDDFEEWLNLNYSFDDVDILLAMPVGYGLLDLKAKHPTIMRLMETYDLTFDELQERNLDLRQDVYSKLVETGLIQIFPWRPL
jgi:hypothetical protein